MQKELEESKPKGNQISCNFCWKVFGSQIKILDNKDNKFFIEIIMILKYHSGNTIFRTIICSYVDGLNSFRINTL